MSSPRPVRQAWHLPSTELSVRSLRKSLRGALDLTLMSTDQLGDLLMAASEAATNAVEHAQRPTEAFFDVLAEVDDGQVTITVQDHGRWRDGPPTQHRGRGLQMMAVLADTTITALPEGTTVTLRIHAGPAHPVGVGATTH